MDMSSAENTFISDTDITGSIFAWHRGLDHSQIIVENKNLKFPLKKIIIPSYNIKYSHQRKGEQMQSLLL